jgi:hypothetical protein
MTPRILSIAVLLCATELCRADGVNLVDNGSFEQSTTRPGVPDFWSAAGNAAIRQELGLDTGRDGRRCARLRFTAIAFAHGIRKIFFHAGTCGRLNGPGAGGVLFDYGGTPRKMYAAVAALTLPLGVPDDCERVVDRDGLHGYVFRAKSHSVAVVWCNSGRTRRVESGPTCQAYDIMGNQVAGHIVVLNETPVYLVGRSAQAVLELLTR